MTAGSRIRSEELSFIEDGVESGLKVLDAIVAEFQTDPSDESEYWIKRTKDIKSHLNGAKAVIGFIGATGAGKSTCVNAFLGDDYSPVSDSQACTSCPVEYAYNDSDSGCANRAEVEFLEEKVWVQDANTAISGLPRQGLCIDWKKISHGDLDDNQKLNFDTIRAIKPNIMLEQPSKLSTVDLCPAKLMENLKCKVKKFESNDLAEFGRFLQQYIGCRCSDEDQESVDLWPIVRRVKIYVKAPILERGMIIVDLPGVQDNNTARAAVAKKYIDKCTTVLVLSPIVRAIDDKTARDLLLSYFGKQLRMNGTLHHVVFVCTKTDEGLKDGCDERMALAQKLKPTQDKIDEVEKLLKNLDESCKELDSQQYLHDNPLHESMKAFSKRKRADHVATSNKQARQKDSSPSGNECMTSEDFEVANSQMYEVVNAEDEQDKYRKIREQLHIEHSRNHLQSRLQELKMQQTLDNIGHFFDQMHARNQKVASLFQPELVEGFRQNLKNGNIRYKTLIAKEPKVFCVSADAYLKLLRDPNDERARFKGFLCKEDTGLPALKEHCQALETDLRLRCVARFVIAFNEMLNSTNLRIFEDQDKPSLSGEGWNDAESRFADILEHLNEGLETSVKNIIDKFIAVFSTGSRQCMRLVQQRAQQESGKVCDGWKSIKWQTYCATLRRDGVFTNSRGQTYDFNYDLGKMMYEDLDEFWDHRLNHQIPSSISKTLTKCRQLVQNFDKQASAQLKAVGGTPKSLNTLQMQKDACLKTLEGNFRDAKLAFMVSKKALGQLFVTVANTMIPGYRMAAAQTGRRKMQRIYCIIANHLKVKQQGMFGTAADNVEKVLVSRFHTMGTKLQEKVKQAVQTLIQDYRRCLTKDDKEIRKRQLQHFRAIHPTIHKFGDTTLGKLTSMLERLGCYQIHFMVEDGSAEYPDDSNSTENPEHDAEA